MGSQSESKIVGALQRLATDGWLPLRQVGILLGYSHPTAVYPRARSYASSRSFIPTVKVGSTLRVHVDDVIRALENVPERDKEISDMILAKYRQILTQTSTPTTTTEQGNPDE